MVDSLLQETAIYGFCNHTTLNSLFISRVEKQATHYLLLIDKSDVCQMLTPKNAHLQIQDSVINNKVISLAGSFHVLST